MRYFLGGGLLAVVLGLHGLSFLTGAAGLSRILSDVGAPAWAPWAGSGFIELAKAILLVASVTLVMTPGVRAKALGLVCAVIWLSAVALSVAATKGTVSDVFAARERAAGMSTERRAFLAAELRDAEAQLSLVQASRPVPVLRAEVERLKLHQRWTSSEGCTNATASESRAFCDQFQRTFAELAGAESAGQVRARIADLRRDLGHTPATASTDPMVASFEMMFGRAIGMPGMDGIAMLVVIAAELGSTFGIAMVGLVMGRRDRHELQERHEALDALADGQVAALTKAAREIRATAGTIPAAGSGDDGEPPPRRLPKPDNDAHPHITSERPAGRAEGQTTMAARDNLQRGPEAPLETLVANLPDEAPEAPRPARAVVALVGSNVSAFAQDCLVADDDATCAASDVRAAYEAWCRARGEEPQTLRAFGTQLNAVVPEKWKTGGLIRYRGIRLARTKVEVA